MQKNKRAWIRIAEAVSAILLLTSVVLILATRTTDKQDISSNMYNLQRAILDEASRNETTRNAVLNYNPSDKTIDEFLRSRLPAGFSFNFSLCSPVQTCYNPGLPKGRTVYVEDIIITTSSASAQINSTKLAFFVWIE